MDFMREQRPWRASPVTHGAAFTCMPVASAPATGVLSAGRRFLMPLYSVRVGSIPDTVAHKVKGENGDDHEASG